MQCDEYRYSVDVSNKNLVNNKTLWLFFIWIAVILSSLNLQYLDKKYLDKKAFNCKSKVLWLFLLFSALDIFLVKILEIFWFVWSSIFH